MLGPFPIVPVPSKLADGQTADASDPKFPVPTLSLILHQSLARVPVESRIPSYPESLAIEESETNRVYVGPIKLKLDFKVKEVKVRRLAALL